MKYNELVEKFKQIEHKQYDDLTQREVELFDGYHTHTLRQTLICLRDNSELPKNVSTKEFAIMISYVEDVLCELSPYKLAQQEEIVYVK